MALTVCSDVSPAGWIVASDLPWPQLVTFGPAGFAGYARVRFIPDPTREGQRKGDVDIDASPDEIDQWRALLQILAEATADPDDCYFGLWDGWSLPASARCWPTFDVAHPAGGRPVRSYFLFHGSLAVDIPGTPADAGIWGPEFSHGGTPAFVWPSDHAWCVTADIDPHWAAVGGSVPTIQRLLVDPRLDAVSADPAAKPPAYR
jgi:hypothetical protein